MDDERTEMVLDILQSAPERERIDELLAFAHQPFLQRLEPFKNELMIVAGISAAVAGIVGNIWYGLIFGSLAPIVYAVAAKLRIGLTKAESEELAELTEQADETQVDDLSAKLRNVPAREQILAALGENMTVYRVEVAMTLARELQPKNTDEEITK